MIVMKMKKYEIAELSDGERVVWDTETNEHFNFESAVACLNEQQAIIDKQELRLQHIEELLELSENLNKSYREKLIDMNLKMVIDNE